MKKIRSLIIFLTFLFTAFSCDQEDFFELKRPNENPWLSVAELEMGVYQVYYYYSPGPWYSALGTLGLKDFAESDVSQLLPGISGDNYAIEYYNRKYNSIMPAKEIEWSFEYLYLQLTSANAPLKFILDAEEKGEDPFTEMTQEDRNRVTQLKGELLFLRALAHWYLARLYAPPFDPTETSDNNDKECFVLRTTFETNADELKNSTLATVREVYASIQKDFEDAKALLPETYLTNEISSRTRANRYVAAGMLARVYFITGQHSKAKAECDYLLSGPFSLDDDPIESFNRNGGQGSSSEMIWEYAYHSSSHPTDRIPTIFGKNNYNAKNGGRGSSFSRCSWANLTMGYNMLKEIGWMADGKNGDYTILPDALNDKRYNQLYFKLEGYKAIPGGLTTAQQNAHKNTYETVQPGITTPQVWLDKHFRATDGRRSTRAMLRLAEFYLTRSIIRFNEGNVNGAADDLNAVRRRAGLTDIAAANLTADDIHNERVKELSGEHGDRTYYLISLRLPIGIGDRDPGQFSPVEPPYSDYYWQVPLIEQQLNQAYGVE